VAQLGARLNGIEKVRGSNPLSSTSFSCPSVKAMRVVPRRVLRPEWIEGFFM
jgi:hypothetical protein